MILSALPRTGMPPRLANYAEYAEIVGALEASGCIPDYTRIWWDVRPHPRFGTVELRVCDAVTHIEDVVSIAAYYQALVKLLCERVEAGRTVESYHRDPDHREQNGSAARHGLDAPVIDLGEGRTGRGSDPPAHRVDARRARTARARARLRARARRHPRHPRRRKRLRRAAARLGAPPRHHRGRAHPRRGERPRPRERRRLTGARPNTSGPQRRIVGALGTLPGASSRGDGARPDCHTG